MQRVWQVKNKKILFITTGTEVTASSRVRVYDYKPFFERYGFEITIIPHNSSVDSESNVLNNKRSTFIKLLISLTSSLNAVYILS